MSKVILKNILLNDEIVDITIEDTIIKSIIRKEGKIPFLDEKAHQTQAESSTNEHSHSNIDTEVIDYKGSYAVLPAFVNMHTHAAMSLMRGIGEDMVFQDWLGKIWEIEKKIDEEYVYLATKVACLEMIKTGTATFNDQYWFPGHIQKAVAEMGLRAFIPYVVLDAHDKEKAKKQKFECQELYEKSRDWHPDCKFQTAFHAIYSVSEEMMLWTAEFARKHNLLLHIHLSETAKEIEDCKKNHGGLSPVEYLDKLGILDSNVIAAHTLWLSDNDIKILGKREVNCVHNINSNIKLLSGYKFRYSELKNAGANVCLGTDGCASSNNLDMLEAMKTSALIQKVWREDPKVLPVDELLDTASYNGAQALRINSGEVAMGKIADLIIVDTNNSYFLSPAKFSANFIYSAHSDSIDSLIVNGNFLMKERKVKGENDILSEAKKVLKKLS